MTRKHKPAAKPPAPTADDDKLWGPGDPGYDVTLSVPTGKTKKTGKTFKCQPVTLARHKMTVGETRALRQFVHDVLYYGLGVSDAFTLTTTQQCELLRARVQELRDENAQLAANAEKDRKTLDKWGEHFGKLLTEAQRDLIASKLVDVANELTAAENGNSGGKPIGVLRDYYGRENRRVQDALRAILNAPTQPSPSAMVQAVLGMMPHRPTVGTSTNAATIVAGRADQ